MNMFGTENLGEQALNKAEKMLDLRNFEKQGLALQIDHFRVEGGQITLLAAADITQFPSL